MLGPKQADSYIIQSFPIPARLLFLQTAQHEGRGQMAFLRYYLKLTLWSPIIVFFGNFF